MRVVSVSRIKKILMAIGLLTSVGIGAYFGPLPDLSEERAIVQTEPLADPVLPEVEFPHELKLGSTVFTQLRALNVEANTIFEIVRAAMPHYDLKRVRPGARFQLIYSENTLKSLISVNFYFSPMERLNISRSDSVWIAEKPPIEVETKVSSYLGVVTSTLWESAEEAQMDPQLISELADIFAWQIDFAREVRTNDRWRISVEQIFVNQRFVGWGPIVAAEYENKSEVYSTILFRKDQKTVGYFAPNGSSLRRMFLKSPLRFGRLTSRFQRNRFHPVLKIRRPHNGVDYAAPKGTPIRAVGDGVLTFVGRQGGGGNTISIRHNSVYETNYKHMSRFAKGMRRGARIQQGQLIGYVGSTGLSTAPHVHFEFLKSGRHVDPLGQAFPSADPVPAHLLGMFQQESTSRLSALPAWRATDVSFAKSTSATEETMVD